MSDTRKVPNRLTTVFADGSSAITFGATDRILTYSCSDSFQSVSYVLLKIVRRSRTNPSCSLRAHATYIVRADLKIEVFEGGLRNIALVDLWNEVINYFVIKIRGQGAGLGGI